jgi:hypothetical protein
MIAPLNLEVRERPALATLIGAMERLSRCHRIEICRMGRKARAAKTPRIRRLAREANAEARRLAGGEGEASK